VHQVSWLCLACVKIYTSLKQRFKKFWWLSSKGHTLIVLFEPQRCLIDAIEPAVYCCERYSTLPRQPAGYSDHSWRHIKFSRDKTYDFFSTLLKETKIFVNKNVWLMNGSTPKFVIFCDKLLDITIEADAVETE